MLLVENTCLNQLPMLNLNSFLYSECCLNFFFIAANHLLIIYEGGSHVKKFMLLSYSFILHMFIPQSDNF